MSENIFYKNLLFIDDNVENINGAKSLSINAIHLTKNKNPYSEVMKHFKKN